MLVTLKERVKLHKLEILLQVDSPLATYRSRLSSEGPKAYMCNRKQNNGKSLKIAYRHEKKIATKDIITPFISHTTPFAWAIFPNHYNHYNITSPTECPK